MTNIKLITVTNAPHQAEVLRRSAEKNGWDFVCLEVEWRGFGTKLIETYNYLKAHPEVDRFVFADAFDVVVFGTPEEFERKFPAEINMLVSAERGLWPPILHPFRIKHANFNHRFNYPNSGLYFSESWYFKWLIEQYPPFYEIDDQYWLNTCFLLEHGIECEFEQRVFNSHSFVDEGEYTYNNGRVQIMGNEPVFVHSNGKTQDPQLDKLVKEMLV
jgi:hypothetical protein